MLAQSTCGYCQTPLDFMEHHPTILDKCGHVICNKCKIDSITSEDQESGYINVSCPIQSCKLNQENLKDHDAQITHIFGNLLSQKV